MPNKAMLYSTFAITTDQWTMLSSQVLIAITKGSTNMPTLFGMPLELYFMVTETTNVTAF